MHQYELFDGRAYGGSPVTIWRFSLAVVDFATPDAHPIGVIVRRVPPSGRQETLFLWRHPTSHQTPEHALSELLRWVGEAAR